LRYHWSFPNNKEIDIDWGARGLVRNSSKESRQSTAPDILLDKNSWEEESLSQDLPAYDESYVEEDDVPEDLDESEKESSEFNELLDLANRLYSSELNTTDFQGFIQVSTAISHLF